MSVEFVKEYPLPIGCREDNIPCEVPWSVLNGAVRYVADQMTPAWEPVKTPVVEQLYKTDGFVVLVYRSGGLKIVACRDSLRDDPEVAATRWTVVTYSMGCGIEVTVDFDKTTNKWNWKIEQHERENRNS